MESQEESFCQKGWKDQTPFGERERENRKNRESPVFVGENCEFWYPIWSRASPASQIMGGWLAAKEHFQSHRWLEGGRDLTLKRLEALRILLERDLRSFMSLGPKTWNWGFNHVGTKTPKPKQFPAIKCTCWIKEHWIKPCVYLNINRWTVNKNDQKQRWFDNLDAFRCSRVARITYPQGYI